MATIAIILSTTVWTKITAAGESGTVWKKAGKAIVIDHTDQESDATLPLSNLNVTVAKSKRVPLDEDSINPLPISADNVDDIFYAVVIDGDSGTIVADVK